MNSSNLYVLGRVVLGSPLAIGSGAQKIYLFNKTFQGTDITLPLNFAPLIVYCDWEMANAHGLSNGVRFTIVVPGQSKAFGTSVYISNVTTATSGAVVRAALAKAVKQLAATPQLAMVEQDANVVQVPAGGQVDYDTL